MKKEFIGLLCCPYCHGKLQLKIIREKEDEIIEGEFACKKCSKKYMIRDGIPIMI